MYVWVYLSMQTYYTSTAAASKAAAAAVRRAVQRHHRHLPGRRVCFSFSSLRHAASSPNPSPAPQTFGSLSLQAELIHSRRPPRRCDASFHASFLTPLCSPSHPESLRSPASSPREEILKSSSLKSSSLKSKNLKNKNLKSKSLKGPKGAFRPSAGGRLVPSGRESSQLPLRAIPAPANSNSKRRGPLWFGRERTDVCSLSRRRRGVWFLRRASAV